MSYKTIKIDTTEKGFTGFLYNNVLGRIILKPLISPAISKMAGAFMNSALSKPFIKGFIKKNSIDMSDYYEVKYTSFNDFFTRKIIPQKRNIDRSDDAFISPCDSKLSVYTIDSDSCFSIKKSLYSVNELIQDKNLADEYKNGYCLVFRLAVDDYHRYHYIDSGEKSDNYYIKGKLHTVRPIAVHNIPVFRQNCREYTILNTNRFGKIVQIEVGAMMVGKIQNEHQSGHFGFGEEKGRFLFGGSTIVLLVQKDAVQIDKEIIENTQNGYETIVKLGQRIGNSIKIPVLQ